MVNDLAQLFPVPYPCRFMSNTSSEESPEQPENVNLKLR